MSVVTDVILLADCLFEPADLEAVNRWLRERGYRELQSHSGGHGWSPVAMLNSFVATAAISRLDEGAFIAHCLRGVDWRTATRAHTVQLAMQGEYDDGFGLVTVFKRHADDATFDERCAKYAVTLAHFVMNVFIVAGHAQGCSHLRGSGVCECGLLALKEEAYQRFGIDVEDDA